LLGTDSEQRVKRRNSKSKILALSAVSHKQERRRLSPLEAYYHECSLENDTWLTSERRNSGGGGEIPPSSMLVPPSAASSEPGESCYSALCNSPRPSLCMNGQYSKREPHHEARVIVGAMPRLDSNADTRVIAEEGGNEIDILEGVLQDPEALTPHAKRFVQCVHEQLLNSKDGRSGLVLDGVPSNSESPSYLSSLCTNAARAIERAYRSHCQGLKRNSEGLSTSAESQRSAQSTILSVSVKKISPISVQTLSCCPGMSPLLVQYFCCRDRNSPPNL